jgi:hypothetical protein
MLSGVLLAIEEVGSLSRNCLVFSDFKSVLNESALHDAAAKYTDNDLPYHK